MKMKIGILSRLALMVSGLPIFGVLLVACFAPNVPLGWRLASGIQAAAVLAAIGCVLQSSFTMNAEGLEVRNPLSRQLIPWRDFADFSVQRWVVWPYCLHVRTVDGRTIHVFVKARGLGSDSAVAKEEMVRLKLTAQDLAAAYRE